MEGRGGGGERRWRGEERRWRGEERRRGGSGGGGKGEEVEGRGGERRGEGRRVSVPVACLSVACLLTVACCPLVGPASLPARAGGPPGHHTAADKEEGQGVRQMYELSALTRLTHFHYTTEGHVCTTSTPTLWRCSKIPWPHLARFMRDNPAHISPETDESALCLQLEPGQSAGCHGHRQRLTPSAASCVPP